MKSDGSVRGDGTTAWQINGHPGVPAAFGEPGSKVSGEGKDASGRLSPPASARWSHSRIHRLAGGGDRVRLSRDLERDAVAAGYIEPWQHTNARQAAERKPYGLRRLNPRKAPRLAGQLPLLPELNRHVARLREFGGGGDPPAGPHYFRSATRLQVVSVLAVFVLAWRSPSCSQK